jgi:DnaJ like chaperone protein
MPKYTKWIAGSLGWAFGGPIGGLLGFIFGTVVDSMQPGEVHVNHQTLIGDFRASLLVLSAAVMKADGKVVKSELDFVRDFFTRQFGFDAMQEDMLILREVLKKEINLFDVCSQIKQYMGYSERLQLMHYLFGIALADGQTSAAELDTIRYIATYMGLSQADFDSLKSMFVKDVDSAYKILEISPDASDEEVKKAYRRMAMKYHPDKVEHLGEDVKKAANEKFKQLNNAYEDIKKQRGM